MPDMPLNRIFFERELEILRSIISHNYVQVVILSPSTSIHIQYLQIRRGQFFLQRSKVNIHIEIYGAINSQRPLKSTKC
jgi:hypothetical protein